MPGRINSRPPAASSPPPGGTSRPSPPYRRRAKLRGQPAAAAYSALLSVPAIDAAATAVSAGTAADPRLAARTDLPHAAPRNDRKTAPASMDRSHKISLASQSVPHQAPPPASRPAGSTSRSPTSGSACPPTRSSAHCWRTAQNCLYELRNGLNIAGQPRQLAPYSAPTNAGSGLPAISAGGQLQTATAVTYLPTAYPYATLIANAKQLVQAAQGIEGQMLAALQQRDQDLYEQLQASQNLAVATATVQLQTLAVQQVTASVTLAQLQQQTAQLQAGVLAAAAGQRHRQPGAVGHQRDDGRPGPAGGSRGEQLRRVGGLGV